MLKDAYSLAKIGADTAENELNFDEILTKFRDVSGGTTSLAARAWLPAGAADEAPHSPPHSIRSCVREGGGGIWAHAAYGGTGTDPIWFVKAPVKVTAFWQNPQNLVIFVSKFSKKSAKFWHKLRKIR